MNLKKRLSDLGEHFRVAQGNMNLRQWSDEIKRAARAQSDSIEVLYDRTFKKASPPATIDVKAVEVKQDEKKADNPVTGVKEQGVKVEGAAQRVEVQAPVFNIHVPAPSVSVTQTTAEKEWFPTVSVIGTHAFALFCGVLLGILISKLALPVVGLT